MKVLITGVLGFIGTNLAKHYSKNHQVVGIDNFFRQGTIDNYIFLKENFKNFQFIEHDVRNPFPEISNIDVIFHMAAQVGVKESLGNPFNDFKINVSGTLNALEFAKRMKKKPIIIYPSTNKVYGQIENNKPVPEDYPLNPNVPYACSKRVAERYLLLYHQLYNIPVVIFRMSCIYGDYQLGAEEQGWMAWFLIADRTNQPITIYGDGNQLRDVLYIDDLIEIYNISIKEINKTNGKIYNIGGGKNNVLSLNELIKKENIKVPLKFAESRYADQQYYVSDISKVHQELGWMPKTSVKEGLKKLRHYIESRYLTTSS